VTDRRAHQTQPPPGGEVGPVVVPVDLVPVEPVGSPEAAIDAVYIRDQLEQGLGVDVLAQPAPYFGAKRELAVGEGAGASPTGGYVTGGTVSARAGVPGRNRRSEISAPSPGAAPAARAGRPAREQRRSGRSPTHDDDVVLVAVVRLPVVVIFLGRQPAVGQVREPRVVAHESHPAVADGTVRCLPTMISAVPLSGLSRL